MMLWLAVLLTIDLPIVDLIYILKSRNALCIQGRRVT